MIVVESTSEWISENSALFIVYITIVYIVPIFENSRLLIINKHAQIID